jgi:hypothetical protein
MNRREALKRIGISFGVVVSAPVGLGILQGCSQTAGVDWKPQFLSEGEANIMTKMVDIILPATESSPGASEVNVPQFIDHYLQEVVSLDERDRIKEYFSITIEKLKNDSDKDDVESISEEDIEPLIASSLSKTPEEEIEILERVDNYTTANQSGASTEEFGDAASYALITNLRELAIWSYKNSQRVGEEILAYDPIPGEQQGCVNLQDATGGKAWSL